jgi:hypothetical protein
VRNKRKTTEAVGMRSFAYDLPATASEAEILALIDPPQCRCASQRDPRAAAAAEADQS